MNEIHIYQTPDNQIQIEVNFDKDTVWLSQEQISELFQRDRTVITKHINNVFKEGELDETVVCANFAHTTQHGAIQGKTQETKVKYYNLDVIISVGYRVKSQRGTQFRQWATKRLKEYLVQGYSINQKRLEQLEKIVQVIDKSGKSSELQLTEAKGLLEILSQYTQSFILLNQYDSNSLKKDKLSENITYEINYLEAKAAISELKKQLMEKKEASDLFGNEKDESFKGSLQSIVQTFGGAYLYPSIEEQAAHLLYFIIKNHSFSDGNKRIGAFLFIWFLEKNKHRFKKNGEVKINDNALVALAILVAQSQPTEKELIIQLIMNLINTR
jgi:death-on-curing family protein